jgi:hypothetical protein
MTIAIPPPRAIGSVLIRRSLGTSIIPNLRQIKAMHGVNANDNNSEIINAVKKLFI